MSLKMKLCAQDMDIFLGDGKHQFARTGEISCSHLKKAGATGLILGHSETGDDPRIINMKWRTAVANGMADNIVLAGYDWDELPNGWERSSEEERAKVKKKIKEKLKVMMEGINDDEIALAVFGYEPSWGTRGSGKEGVEPPQPEHIGQMCSYMKSAIKDIRGVDARVIYGGSMTGQRAKDIISQKVMDGLILGSAAATLDSLKEITYAMREGVFNNSRGRELILALNWKAYELDKNYTQFLDFLAGLDKKLFDVYLAPAATDIRKIRELLDNF